MPPVLRPRWPAEKPEGTMPTQRVVPVPTTASLEDLTRRFAVSASCDAAPLGVRCAPDRHPEHSTGPRHHDHASVRGYVWERLIPKRHTTVAVVDGEVVGREGAERAADVRGAIRSRVRRRRRT